MKYLKNMNSEEFRKIHYKNIKANEKQIKNTIQHFMNQKQKYFDINLYILINKIYLNYNKNK